MMKWFLLSLVVLASGMIGVAYKLSIHSLFIRNRSKASRIEWQELTPTPRAEDKYAPQGAAYVDGFFLLANTWNDKKSRVYEYSPETMTVLRYFDMPERANHTSGLSWDGRSLWAVDHLTNLAYQIDLEKSLSTGNAAVENTFNTGLRGTSACAVVPVDDRIALAISDFMHSGRTIIVDVDRVLQKESIQDAILFSYMNEGFSQGLEYVDGYLYEAENKIGINVINKLDIKLLRQYGKSRSAIVAQYNAPGRGVEDIAWDGASLWTSDEVSYRIYRSDLITD